MTRRPPSRNQPAISLKPMNLGAVYIQSVMLIVSVVVAIPLAVEFYCRWKHGKAWRGATILAVIVVASLLVPDRQFIHRPVFTWLHERQNDLVPQNGRLTYEPHPTQLIATYRMDRATFDEWAREHPWQLSENDDFVHFDGERFGFDVPDVSLASPMADNGRQLRVYFKDGTMYLSYNAM